MARLKQLCNLLTQRNNEKDVIIERLEKENTVKNREVFELQKLLE